MPHSLMWTALCAPFVILHVHVIARIIRDPSILSLGPEDGPDA